MPFIHLNLTLKLNDKTIWAILVAVALILLPSDKLMTVISLVESLRLLVSSIF